MPILVLLATFLFASSEGVQAKTSAASGDGMHCAGCADDMAHGAAMTECAVCSICVASCVGLDLTAAVGAPSGNGVLPPRGAEHRGSPGGFDPPPPRM